MTYAFMTYEHKQIEEKWQEIWKKNNLYHTRENEDAEKFYVLDMFPYPSGQGLHVGHPKGYIATDIIARKKMMEGRNVLHPMGWDAFGLPAENYAIANKIHPEIAVAQNIIRFKAQLEKIGCTYDWEREINTTDPSYYKWTQWAFLKMFERGLAYESFEPINWCPSCQTGLANEDLEDGRCERCGSTIEKKPLRQWVLRITDYAERLLTDLDDLEWPEAIKESQRHWIGKSEGAEVDFVIMGSKEKIIVFTTRPETIMGVTYIVVAPESPLIESLQESLENKEEVRRYIEAVKNKSEIERTALGKEKSGVPLRGVFALHPITKEKLPVWIADYVLADYGTGAVMAVPAGDERDADFAAIYNLPVKPMDDPGTTEIGRRVTKYKLRDWVFSRQRYWGEPIPLIHCPQCGVVPVPEKELPLRLPNVESYAPSGTGESPLATIEDWVNVECPRCGTPGKRETNTMPQWAGSSWYYLRYIDPKNDLALVAKDKEAYWSPVDLYIGGAEHATRHLIYARFWHKFLFDIGVVSRKEPFARYSSLGLIMGEDGRKMSKRWGNIVNPDEMIASYGADALRLYEMFIGPFTQSASFKESGVAGAEGFLRRIWLLQEKIGAPEGKECHSVLHRTIKKVGEDIDGLRFNTAVSSLMILVNAFAVEDSISEESFEILLRLLAPFAPHITEELWHREGRHADSIFNAQWPAYREDLLRSETITIAVQVNGKLRDTLEMNASASEEEVKKSALESERVKPWLEHKEIKKIIIVPGKLVSIVVQ